MPCARHAGRPLRQVRPRERRPEQYGVQSELVGEQPRQEGYDALVTIAELGTEAALLRPLRVKWLRLG
jgi:hypothetical protein